jgi:hypothetical protein
MNAAEARVVDHELEQIESWRLAELERAGYAPDHAAVIACRHDIDLHFAVGLLEKGCDPALAVKIVL